MLHNALQHPACWLLLLLVVSCEASQATPIIYRDSDFGISTISSLLLYTEQLLHLRAFLRADCSSNSSITIAGFVGLSLPTKKPPDVLRGVHFLSFNVMRKIPRFVIVNKAAHPPTKTFLQPTGPRDPAYEGLVRVQATLDAAGSYELEAGDDVSWSAQLPTPCCSCKADNSSHSSSSSVDTNPLRAGGLWNVLTTTSNSVIPLEDLAFLITAHNSYHRRLGFNGTILRGGISQAQQLARLSSIQAAVQQEGLLLWPWSDEHSAGEAPHYYQIPKNQLTLLAAYRSNARLAYLDLDEYIVFTQATGSSLDSATCQGQPLLAPGRPSWYLLRFQAKSCNSSADLDCWRAPGATPLPETPSTPFYLSMCAMGAVHGKHIVQPDQVLTVGVHEAAVVHEAAGAAAKSSVIPMECALILHLFSLNHGRRPQVAKRVMEDWPRSLWTLPAGQQGPASVAIPQGQRLRSEKECEDLMKQQREERQRQRQKEQARKRVAKRRAWRKGAKARAAAAAAGNGTTGKAP